MIFEWDENKNLKNIEIHHLDFIDASLVYDSPEKITVETALLSEKRFMDFAEVSGLVLGLVYTYRESYIRVISFRSASRKERRFYYEKRKNS